MSKGTNDFAAIFAASNSTQVASNSNFSGETYVLTREGSATSPGRVKIVSVGIAPNGAIAQLEAWFKLQPWIVPKAILTGGDLKIPGNPKIMGTCGGVHSNDDLQISGNPGIQMVDGVTAFAPAEHQHRSRRVGGFPVEPGRCQAAAPPMGYTILRAR